VFLLETQRPAAERLARLIGGRAIQGGAALSKKNANVLVLTPGTKPSFRGAGGDAPGDSVVFRFSGNPELLLHRVPFGRFRYQVSP
jgi:hypothetical protein